LVALAGRFGHEFVERLGDPELIHKEFKV